MRRILFLALWLYCASGTKLPTVKIPDGKIQGEIASSYNGNSFMQFEGIPFARPPVGKLRFEEPQAVKPWPGTIIANQTIICIQVDHAETYTPYGQEDCLVMNVYVPGNKIDQNKKLDVLVHIHGGAFMFGSGSCYSGPKYLMDRNIVYVTFNYRLGVFGFLSTGDKHLPGNLGMKDQVMALKWVNSNIVHFGGNPDSITIEGLSAGGASVHYHYLSPLSRGLFKRGISNSGCALNSWAFQDKPLDKAIAVGKYVGCKQDKTEDLVKCLKTRNGDQLNAATHILRSWYMNPFSPLAPVVDKFSSQPFLPDNPYQIIADGKVNDVPWIATTTTSEGLYPAAYFVLREDYFKDIRNQWKSVFPAILHYTDTVSEEKRDNVTRTIIDYYLKGKLGRETYLELIQLIGDRLFSADLALSVTLQSSAVKSPIHFYQFNYTGEETESFVALFAPYEETFGVCHGDDMMYIFSNIPRNFPKMTATDEQMKETLLDHWIAYAKSGEISIENWTPVSKDITDPLNYLHIGADQSMEMRTSEDFAHRKFWDSLPLEENRNLLKSNVKTEL